MTHRCHSIFNVVTTVKEQVAGLNIPNDIMSITLELSNVKIEQL